MAVSAVTCARFAREGFDILSFTGPGNVPRTISAEPPDRPDGSVRNHIFSMRLRAKGRLRMYYDIAGVLVLLLDIWALVTIIQSGGAPLEKLLWVILILALPLVGFLIWYLIGPGPKRLRG